MQISDIIKVVSPDTFERPIYAGNAIQTVQSSRQEEGHHRAHHGFPGRRQQRLGPDRDHRGAGARRPFEFREGRDPEIRPARADRGQDRRLRRPRPAVGRELQEVHRAGGRQARRRRRRQPRRRRRRLHAQRLPGRPDRQGGGAGALHRRRHLRRHPASRRHEGQQGDRRHQQGRRGADLPGGRLWPGGRPVPGAARAEDELEKAGK